MQANCQGEGHSQRSCPLLAAPFQLAKRRMQPARAVKKPLSVRPKQRAVMNGQGSKIPKNRKAGSIR